MTTFTIPGRLAGANEIKSANRSHWSIGAKLVKQDRELCEWTVIKTMKMDDQFSVPVAVSFVWVEPNAKRDPDNIISGQKVILDTLVKAGLIPNDTQRWIKRIIHTFAEPDKTNPRIEVTITEAV